MRCALGMELVQGRASVLQELTGTLRSLYALLRLSLRANTPLA